MYATELKKEVNRLLREHISGHTTDIQFLEKVFELLQEYHGRGATKLERVK